MPRDDDKSLGDEATLQGGKPAPADERSLGDRSTFGGGEGSSLSDLGEFADLPDHDMEIVDLSSRYKIEKSLGKGGMGEVLLATDTRLDRKVAIKRIRGDAGSSKAAVARFLTEAKSVAALNHHNIVQIHDYGRDEQGPFLIMEFVPGGSLLDRCKQGPIELEEAIDLACQLCDGLGRAHDAGIIHRDIKPANILLTDEGVPKITDFGLAKAESRDHTMTMTGAVLGTLDFMPPEQRQDASLVDARSDLWSLGATLYQMVTGESPKVIRLNKVPVTLQNLLDKALEESKDSRYQTAQELHTALTESELGSQQTAPMIQDLGAGECPQCHTLNESTRKFCRECAALLLVPCLQCSQQMPIWDNICGECGGRQDQLLEQRNAQYAVQREEATRLHADNRFTDAIKLLKPLRSIEDQRFSDVSQWARTYSTDLQEESERLLRETKERFAEAKKHREAFDYPAAIASMQKIRSPFLTSQMSDYLKHLQADQRESDELLEKIREAIKSNDVEDLLPRVERALKLRGDRNDLPKLQAQLVRRDSKQKRLAKSTFINAKKLLDKQEYEQAISALSEVPPKHVDHEVRQLKTVAELKLDSLRTLDDEITSKQSDEDADFDHLTGLLRAYLKLKSHDRLKQQLLDKLVAERNALIKHDQLLLAEANAKHEAQDYTGALDKLQRITYGGLLQQVEGVRSRVNANRNRMGELDRQIQETLVDGIWRVSVQQLDQLRFLLDEYLTLQKNNTSREQLRDDLIALAEAETCYTSQDYSGAVASLQTIETELILDHCSELKKKAEEAATRVNDLHAKIQQAVTNEQRDDYLVEVKQYLELKPNDGAILQLRNKLIARARIEKAAAVELAAKQRTRKRQVIAGSAIAATLVLMLSVMFYLRAQGIASDISEALGRGDYAAALELDPENGQARAMKQNAEDLATALGSRDYQKALRLDPSNTEALSMKRAADIQQALSDGDYATTLQLDPANAEALSMKKAADLQRALSDGDYAAALQLAPRNRQALSMKKADLQQAIQQALSDGDYAAALQLDPNDADALSMKKKTDIQQALSNGDYAAALQLDPSNPEALSMKKAAGIQQALSMKKKVADIQQALSDGDYATALQLDRYNAEAMSMKKAADIQQALSDGDYAAALQLHPSNVEALSMKKRADIQQALSDGDYAAALQLDPSGVEILKLPPITNSIGMELKFLPPGEFDNGANEMKVKNSFFIGIYEVTQAQYEELMSNNPSKFKGRQNPVDQVDAASAVRFCSQLSALPAENSAGRMYRLPTEEEWEYACRANTTTKYNFGNDESTAIAHAWYNANSDKKTHSVGSKLPNAWGIHDMHGNVWEWCQVRYGDRPVLRGGSWFSSIDGCRSAARLRFAPVVGNSSRRTRIGFRVVCVQAGK